MFKNEYQGGSYFEILNPSLKDPLVNFKITGSNGIQKIFDKEVKGSVYQLDGIPTTTKISTPKESRHGLSLIQRYIALQLNIKLNQEFSIEIGICDMSQNKRNVNLSTSHKELNVQPLSARVPIKNINRSQWTNFVIDLAALVGEIWKNQTFKSIEYLSVGANCKLRKVFTLKNAPEVDLALDTSLVGVDFPEGTDSKLQIFNLAECQLVENTIESLPLSSINSKPKSNVFKIAFGTKVPLDESNSSMIQQSQQTFRSNKSQSQIDQSNKFDKIGQEKETTIGGNSAEGDDNQQIGVLSQEIHQKAGSKDNAASKIISSSLAKLNAKTEKIVKTQEHEVEEFLDSNVSLPDGPLSESQKTIVFLSENENDFNNSPGQTNKTVKKIPHPPPKSTRPSGSPSARKLRAAAKTNSSATTPNIYRQLPASATTVSVSPKQAMISPLPKSATVSSSHNRSHHFEDHSNSDTSKTTLSKLFHSRKHSNKQTDTVKTSEDQVNGKKASKVAACNSNIGMVYTFSSRPKAVVIDDSEVIIDKVAATAPPKMYDPKNYATVNTTTISKLPLSSMTKHTTSSNENSLLLARQVIQTTINNVVEPLTNYNEMMDSFEARMLQEIKEEMESTRQTSKTSKYSSTNKDKQQEHKLLNQSKQNKTTTLVNSKTQPAQHRSNTVVANKENNNSITTPELEYIQRESSGIQSPLSDYTTSEKYNFEAASSIEDTASISKKLINRKTAFDESNNYQDEMNVSLQSNLPAKSVNLKDIPPKNSPLLVQQQAPNKLHKSPITEEPTEYDDSQADIEEINSEPEDEIDLLYDPALNCYYDPKTCTYYELNMS